MRLLQRDSHGNYSPTPNLPAGDIPPYAILSHTWGPDEVILPDLQGAGHEWQQKAGYQKLQFCVEQAARHGLRYVWVDTCCIDKSNSIELQTAINSMFQWYRDAARCYVYMTDVSKSEASNDELWKTSFRDSRWFTRGWTLQELIAPKMVEFYSKEGVLLGDKQSLEHTLRDITRVPTNALRGTPLSEFTIAERESWVRNRETKYEEDMAYSLLGIFNVFLPLIYGEGKSEAQRRLREEIRKATQGANDFSITFSLAEAPPAQRFVAREEELAEIRRTLISDGSRRVVVLHGLGGIGKTQLAVAYLKRHRDEYSAVFWVNIKDEHSARQSFVKIAKQIRQQYPETRLFRELSPGDVPSKDVEAVKAWLSLPGNTRWLIVYDNYDEVWSSGDESRAGVDIDEFLPTAHQGAIIITTRLSLIDLGHVIRVKKLESMADSLEILSSTSGRASLRGDPDAEKLVEKLDGLPLALVTAGAYLRRVAMTLADYLRHYDTSWERLHETTPNIGSYKDRTLCSTWQISYQRVEAQTPLAAQLLRLWAYFDNQDLWLDLVNPNHDGAPPWLRALGDELTFNEVMGTLHDYGFVEPCAHASGSQGYSIHGCLHSWTRHVLNRERSASLGRIAVACVTICVPGDRDPQYMRLRRRLVPHAKASFASIQDLIGDMDDFEWILGALGFLYSSQDMFADAEHVFAQAFESYERKFGLDHEKSLSALARLGQSYREQNRMKEAEDAFLRALRGQERLLGTDHSLLVFTLDGLAYLYTSQLRFAEAEAVYQRVVDMQERLRGPDDPGRLASLSRMAQLYADQRKLEKAEELFLHVLERIETLQGKGCQSALWTLSDLGNLYLLGEKMTEAEGIFLRALDGTRELLGPEHPDTLYAMASLVFIFESQARLPEAETMCLEVVRGYEGLMGRENRTTVLKLIHLASIYSQQGRHGEAEKICLGILDETERTWGPGHVNSMSTMRELGHLHQSQNRLPEAEDMFLRALDGWDEAYGQDHIDKLALVSSLGQVCMEQGRLGEAEVLLGRALRGYAASIAPAHFARYRPALNATADMGGLRFQQRRYGEARAYYQRAHDDFLSLLGPDNVTVRSLREDLLQVDQFLREQGGDGNGEGPEDGEVGRTATDELERRVRGLVLEAGNNSDDSDTDSGLSVRSQASID